MSRKPVDSCCRSSIIARPLARPQIDGVVEEALPNSMFRVAADSGQSILATVGGRMRGHTVKVLPGDRVALEISPYDPGRGRIIHRHT